MIIGRIVKFNTFSLSFCLLFLTFSFSSLASEFNSVTKNHLTDKYYTLEREKAVWDEELQAYVIPLKSVNGTLQPVSPDIYLREISSTPIEIPEGSDFDEVAPDRAYFEYWRYTPKSTSQVTGSARKVSADIYCNTSAGCRISKKVSTTVSASYSVSATAERNAIKANAGFTWVNSASDSTTYSFNLKKGQKGYIAFRPYLRKTSGTLKKYSNWDGLIYQKSAYAYSPKKTSSGEADGYYYFVFK